MENQSGLFPCSRRCSLYEVMKRNRSLMIMMVAVVEETKEEGEEKKNEEKRTLEVKYQMIL